MKISSARLDLTGVALISALFFFVFFVTKQVNSDVGSRLSPSSELRAALQPPEIFSSGGIAAGQRPPEILRPEPVRVPEQKAKRADETAEPLPMLEEIIFKKAELAEARSPLPYYPRIARRNGYEGIVLLNLLVSESGRVESVEIIRSSGYKVLDREAVKAVRKWRFVPAEQAGETVASHVEVPVVFRLGE
jgi:protein TonB